MRQDEAQTYLINNMQIQRVILSDQIKAQYPNLIFNEIGSNLYTVTVQPQFESEFNAFRVKLEFVSLPILYGLNANQALEASNITLFHSSAFGELRGRGIIIGFVDTGIQYTNELFKNANNTTRIVGIWDQTITSGAPPQKYNYGTYYNENRINEALAAEDPYTVVPSRDENGHGTYLAGVAAGNDQMTEGGYVGGAPDADILVVKLREATVSLKEHYLVEPNVVAYAENDVIAGISFLVEESVRQQKPLVICLGLGSNYGAHNGTNILERYLETLSLAQNIIIIIAAGNESNLGHHYEGTITTGEIQELEINVAENSTGFPIYLWTTLPDKLTVSVKSPLGQVVEKVPILPNQSQVYRFNLEQTELTITYIYPDPETGGEKIEIRLKAPTPGLWTINMIGEDVVNGIFHMWLPRKDFIREATRFLKAAPDTTIQIPATAEYTIAIGAYDYVDGSIYIGSGRGPTTAAILKPDFIAPGVNVEGPSISGGMTTYVGTSTAAAVTAGAAAILMQWAVIRENLPQMNTRIARVIFMRGAMRQRGVTYPNNIEGYGKLDLRASIANI